LADLAFGPGWRLPRAKGRVPTAAMGMAGADAEWLDGRKGAGAASASGLKASPWCPPPTVVGVRVP